MTLGVGLHKLCFQLPQLRYLLLALPRIKELKRKSEKEWPSDARAKVYRVHVYSLKEELLPFFFLPTLKFSLDRPATKSLKRG